MDLTLTFLYDVINVNTAVIAYVIGLVWVVSDESFIERFHFSLIADHKLYVVI
jgi:hypothetical protein